MRRKPHATTRVLSRLAAIVCTMGVLLSATSGVLARGAGDYLGRDAAWFGGDEAAKVAESILSWQSPLGGWPKNLDTTAANPNDATRVEPTFDNGATVNELRFLARMCAATGEEQYGDAFARGLDYILKAQYSTGGWPQHYPPGRSYPRHITFNDNAMVRLMQFVREVAGDELYAFVDADRRVAAKEAFDRGVECILKCQIEVDGKLTAWCAQHDEIDYQPRPARTYELVSLSGSESVGIVRLLMSLDEPSPDVVRAVESAVAWLESAKIEGIRIERHRDANAPRGLDKRVVHDPGAPPLWARFYDIQTNRPIFCDRDGVPKASLAEIGYERRNGYAWYGSWARELLEEEYPAWRNAQSASRE
jgi:pectate lyase